MGIICHTENQINCWNLSDTEPPSRQHTPATMRSQTHTAEACRVWTQSEKMHLTLERLEAPGSGEVGGGWDILLEMGGVWDVEQRVDWEGDKEWTVKKRLMNSKKRKGMKSIFRFFSWYFNFLFKLNEIFSNNCWYTFSFIPISGV